MSTISDRLSDPARGLTDPASGRQDRGRHSPRGETSMARGPVSMEGRVSAGWSAALRFVVLLGVVSLFADVTYEGARSITGPYLAVLGASGAVVGIVAGAGELVGYA